MSTTTVTLTLRSNLHGLSGLLSLAREFPPPHEDIASARIYLWIGQVAEESSAFVRRAPDIGRVQEIASRKLREIQDLFVAQFGRRGEDPSAAWRNLREISDHPFANALLQLIKRMAPELLLATVDQIVVAHSPGEVAAALTQGVHPDLDPSTQALLVQQNAFLIMARRFQEEAGRREARLAEEAARTQAVLTEVDLHIATHREEVARGLQEVRGAHAAEMGVANQRITAAEEQGRTLDARITTADAAHAADQVAIQKAMWKCADLEAKVHGLEEELDNVGICVVM